MVDYNSSYTGAQIDANLAKAATAVQPTNNATALGSGSATNGQVLSANGSGGTTWATASGGGGTPGGSDTQVQFNDGGAFGGDSGFTFDKTNNTLGLGGGTITASDPIIDMAQTWNNAAVAFTAIKANVTDTASAAGSLLMDLQVGGVSRAGVTKAGAVFASAANSSTPVFALAADLTSGFGFRSSIPNITTSGSTQIEFVGGETRIGGSSAFTWASNTTSNPGAVSDLRLARDAANTLGQRNGVNAQAFNLYNTYTDASNYERGVVHFTGNTFWFRTQAAGTGASRDIGLSTAGSIYIDANNGTYFRSSGGTLYGQITNDGLSMTGRFLQMTEQTAPAAPAANGVRIYAEDDGAGKTRLMARFATGAAQVIALEP